MRSTLDIKSAFNIKYRLSFLPVFNRKGIKIKPEPRPVNCYGTSILDFQSPELTFSVACGGGFYVRSLVHDLGLSTWPSLSHAWELFLLVQYFSVLSSCAHVVDLERTRQGPFTLEHCLLEDELTPATVGKQIDILRPLLEVYLDQAMAEFREGKLIKQEIIGNSPPSWWSSDTFGSKGGIFFVIDTSSLSFYFHLSMCSSVGYSPINFLANWKIVIRTYDHFQCENHNEEITRHQKIYLIIQNKFV